MNDTITLPKYAMKAKYFSEANRLFNQKKYGELYLLFDSDIEMSEILVKTFCLLKLGSIEEALLDLRLAADTHGLPNIISLFEDLLILSKIIDLNHFKLDYYWTHHTNLYILTGLINEVIDLPRLFRKPHKFFMSALLGIRLSVKLLDEFYSKDEYLKAITGCMIILNEWENEEDYDISTVYSIMMNSFERINQKQLKRFLPMKANNPSDGLLRLRKRILNASESNYKKMESSILDYDNILAKLVGFDSQSSTPTEYRVSDSKQYQKYLILQPQDRDGKKHNNMIHWFDQNGTVLKEANVRNDPFDFLYYLAWLSKEGKEKGMLYKASVSKNDISAIIEDPLIRKKLRRFETAWANGNEDQKNKKMSIVNGYFGYSLIVKHGIYYCINDGISVELKPFPKI